jgi:hypothetical protein
MARAQMLAIERRRPFHERESAWSAMAIDSNLRGDFGRVTFGSSSIGPENISRVMPGLAAVVRSAPRGGGVRKWEERPSQTWGVMPRAGRDDRFPFRRPRDRVRGCRSSPRIEP